jgi:hypothetical protein
MLIGSENELVEIAEMLRLAQSCTNNAKSTPSGTV